MAESLSAPERVQIAVLFADRDASIGFEERLKAAVIRRSDVLRTAAGRLGELDAVSVTLPSGVGATDRAVTAVVTSYRPRLLVGCGFAVARQPLTGKGLVVAQRAVDAHAELHLVVPPWVPTTLSPAVLSVTGADGLACEWAFPLADACRRLETPLLLVAAASPPPEERPSDELKNIERQRSVSGKLGAVVGAAWRKPSSLRELWARRSHLWEEQERLADALVQIAQAHARHPHADLPPPAARG